MAIESVNHTQVQTYLKNSGNPSLKETGDLPGKRAHGQPQLPEQAADRAREAQATKSTLRQERQADIVAHLFGDKEAAPGNAVRITFQEAIEQLNKILQKELNLGEKDALPISEGKLKSQGGINYWSPENTAKRIVDNSVAFLSAYQQANPELEGEALIDRFLEVMGGGVDQGFEQARGILGDLEVLEGDIKSNVDQTYELVQQGFADYKAQFMKNLNGGEAVSETGSEPETAQQTPEETATENRE